MARSVPPVALKACAAVLERLMATDPATGPRVLDFDLSLDDPTTCLRLDAATLRALALVDAGGNQRVLPGEYTITVGVKGGVGGAGAGSVVGKLVITA